jgi:hypothetical protein
MRTQLVAACEKISEAYLLPVIRQLLAGFPFFILVSGALKDKPLDERYFL